MTLISQEFTIRFRGTPDASHKFYDRMRRAAYDTAYDIETHDRKRIRVQGIAIGKKQNQERPSEKRMNPNQRASPADKAKSEAEKIFKK